MQFSMDTPDHIKVDLIWFEALEIRKQSRLFVVCNRSCSNQWCFAGIWWIDYSFLIYNWITTINEKTGMTFFFFFNLCEQGLMAFWENLLKIIAKLLDITCDVSLLFEDMVQGLSQLTFPPMTWLLKVLYDRNLVGFSINSSISFKIFAFHGPWIFPILRNI